MRNKLVEPGVIAMDLQKGVGKNSALPGIPRIGPMTNDRRAVHLVWCPRINWTLLSVSSARQSAARLYLFQRLSTSRELLPESNPPWPSRRMVSGCHSIGKKKARTRGGPRRGGRPAAAEPAVVPKAIEIEGLSEHEFSAIWKNRALARKL